MKKNKLLPILAILLLITSCTKTDNPVQENENAINISGLLTRADGEPRTNIYVKAFHPGPANVYFNETLVSLPNGLTPGVQTTINFVGASPYYPLDETNDIRLFAYSGRAPSDLMVLTSGTTINNDAILSNYGKRRSDAAANPTYAPEGTPGSISDPAEVLQFRHVMTQLIVDVELGTPQIDAVPQVLQFTLDGGAVSQGRLGIRATEAETATDTTGTYTIQLGTNYLVPTGIDILGKQLTSLVIDNYTATPTDLQGFTIQALEGQPSMQLMPGYSYRMTFTINRLQVTGITLTKIDWIPHETSGNVSYDASTLTLDMGADYPNTGDDAVNKVILSTEEGRTYVGRTIEGQTGVKFVTLPETGVNRVALYTPRGLLLTSGVTAEEYSNYTLTLPVSVGGMVPENPAAPAGPDNPYLITTPVQFMNMAKDLTAHYRQAVTIDLRALNLIESVRIFNGFGDFTGTYDGNGFRIDELDIASAGLFNSIGAGSVVRNVRISTGTIDGTGQTAVGSICGVNNGTIVACINEGRIVNSDASTAPQGGICGINSGTGNVIACLNTGTILYGTTVGGICGTNQNVGANTFVSCINTGMLNPNAASLGFICGTSVDSPNAVINTSFSLVGSAQHFLGAPEEPIGSGTVDVVDTSTLEPLILRNNLESGVTNENLRVVNRLNTAIGTTAWGSTYQYVFNNAVTAVTWPAPMKI